MITELAEFFRKLLKVIKRKTKITAIIITVILILSSMFFKNFIEYSSSDFVSKFAQWSYSQIEYYTCGGIYAMRQGDDLSERAEKERLDLARLAATPRTPDAELSVRRDRLEALRREAHERYSYAYTTCQNLDAGIMVARNYCGNVGVERDRRRALGIIQEIEARGGPQAARVSQVRRVCGL